ncbi:SpoIID/LytB domain-containing protein [Deinococcus radiopugnans]|uniref:SpoIID/LytB domain-containing protein n=1 Tax=Deinococcus radiopugnans ATCC 19172 TaxID=585398 RepID=A0A5C4YB60_9DEIO|nr:SpoIID/LytB domain-containing protein [Deinococcus radiopugnans]MBB6015947.1 stage II sporulation protein D [Deinococcus radiopugnans ATCC 19172]TNM72361.1 SpoIID/LytB domain-containing protein [Deinococcus radiopugnans ATCC 19172]
MSQSFPSLLTALLALPTGPRTRPGRPVWLGPNAALGAALCGALVCAAPASALNVRVLVAAAPQLTVRVPVAPAQPGAVRDALTPPGLPAAPPQMTVWTVGVSGGQLTLNGQAAGNPTLYLPPSPGSVVEIAGKPYRGGVLLRVQDGGVQGVNVVDVEDYLRGVVPAEMPASWPAAALAAQAVIARTYVAARINPAAPFDTCATESCQVYPGLKAEKPEASAAIDATRAQVVAYAGRPASTYFSSDSGGFTASSAEVWGKELPYLRAQADPYSAGSPRAGWRVEVTAAQVQTVAARYGARVGSLRAVSVTRLSPSGRPAEITVSGDGGTARITGANAGGFVRSLGAPGTRISLSGLNPLVISGSGAGHGVGLSQYGALGLARAGQDHLKILGFYYPGTSLSVLAGQRNGGGAVLAGSFPLPSAAQTLALALHSRGEVQ